MEAPTLLLRERFRVFPGGVENSLELPSAVTDLSIHARTIAIALLLVKGATMRMALNTNDRSRIWRTLCP